MKAFAIAAALSAGVPTFAAGQAADAPEAAPAAQAQAPDEGWREFLSGLVVSGFVDGYYSYNSNHVEGDAPLRNFDTKHNAFSLNLVEVAVERKPDANSRVGFRADFNAGPTADLVHLFEPAGVGKFSSIQQAYVSYFAPVGGGLTFDFGKMVTPMGAELIETKDNWNYSRSLLFALAIPYYHMGARVTYTVNDKFTIAGHVVNGWNNVFENNDAKTVHVQGVVKPIPAVTIYGNYMFGAEQPDNDDDIRHVFDTTVSVALPHAVDLMMNFDYGTDEVDGEDVEWQGIAGYVRWRPYDFWGLAARGEWYDDDDGFTTALAQTVKEFTVTSENSLGGLLFRLELRHDWSDEAFFIDDEAEFEDSQTTVSFGLVYSFSSAQ
jgi:hypothetical protein